MKVTVVIPAYNEELYIGRCLETLMGQTYKDLDVIIVDDGSSDSTRDIVQEMAKRYRRIKLLRQQRGGPGRARNLGAQHAKGDILVLVDADMEFDQHYIARLIKPIIDGDAVGTFHREERVANTDNVWARCWGTTRVDPKTAPKKMTIFRAILRKEFLRIGGFDPAKGSFDDQSVGQKGGIESIGVDGAICYHNNPTCLGEVFRQNRWIGGSFIVNPSAIFRYFKRFWPIAAVAVILVGACAYAAAQFLPWQCVAIAALPALIIGLIVTLTARRLISEPDAAFIIALPLFHIAAFAGFTWGALKQALMALWSILRRRRVEYKY